MRTEAGPAFVFASRPNRSSAEIYWATSCKSESAPRLSTSARWTMPKWFKPQRAELTEDMTSMIAANDLATTEVCERKTSK